MVDQFDRWNPNDDWMFADDEELPFTDVEEPEIPEEEGDEDL